MGVNTHRTPIPFRLIFSSVELNKTVDVEVRLAETAWPNLAIMDTIPADGGTSQNDCALRASINVSHC
jgi:hypothetical protein